MIVEDSKTQAVQLENILLSHQYKVGVAEDGSKALAWLAENRPALVISDIMMPEMDGYELCRQIKTRAATQDIPVVLLTSLSGTDEVIEGLIAGADCFITKPYDKEYLLHQIEKIIADKNKYPDERQSFGVEIDFKNKKRLIRSDPQQIINLLLNIYEGAIQQNSLLIETREKLNLLNENLESLVNERTSELLAKTEASIKAEESLRISEIKYSELFHNSQVAMYRSKLDGSAILVANKKLAELFDCSEEELIGNPALIRWADPESRKKMILELQGSGSINNYEIEIITKTKKRKTTLASLALYSAEGYLEGSVMDITDAKKSGAELKWSETQLQSTLEATADGILAVSNKGEIIKANQRFFDLWNIPKQMMETRNDQLLLDFVQNQLCDPDLFIKKIRELYISDMAVMDLLKFKDNRTFERYSFPMYMEGDIIGRVWSFRDITARKQAEEALLEARETLERRVLQRTMALAKNKKLLDETSKLARIGGWELETETKNLIWTDMVYEIHETGPGFIPNLNNAINFYKPESLPIISEAVRSALEDGKPFDTELQIITAKGNLLWVRSIGKAFREGSKITRIGGVIQDITEFKKAEEELSNYRKHLEDLVISRTKEKDKFFTIIAHDLRSPFNSLLGFTEILAGGVEKFTLEEIQKMVNRLHKSADNLFKLLENLLSWSRLQRGMMEYVPLKTNLFEIISNNLIIHSLETENKSINILNTVPPETETFADPQMLSAIFRNLISNAIKFTRNGGSISIGFEQNNGMAQIISIRDTGIGIPDEMKEKLFSIGEDVSRTGTGNEPSTGLGLLLCKEYVDKHGGKIWVESEEGKGSTFSFTLPLPSA